MSNGDAFGTVDKTKKRTSVTRCVIVGRFCLSVSTGENLLGTMVGGTGIEPVTPPV